jgi:hypothetical protein
MEITMNRIRLTAYFTGTSPVLDSKLERARNIRFSTIYPGGNDAELSFSVPVLNAQSWNVKVNHRIVVRSGFKIVWEGKIVSITPDRTPGAVGILVVALGYWAAVAMRQMVFKAWADSRLEEDIWRVVETDAGFSKMTLDRQNRIRFTPKAVAWTTNQTIAVKYTCPTGQTIKRISFNYDLQEAAQNWTIGLSYSGGLLWSASASGTGTQDYTYVTPRDHAFLYLGSGANQTPAADGTIYGQFSSVVVYTETGAIDGQQVAIDVAGYMSEISTDTTKIGALTYSLVPFVTESPEYIADILARATKYGDSSNNLWAAYIGRSDKFRDGKPGLVLEQQPVLTSADYTIRLGAPNVEAGAQFSKDTTDMRNYFFVRYTDDAGIDRTLSPDDDATLTDSSSSAAYGRSDEGVEVDTTSATNAKQYAKTLLAARSEVQWKATGAIRIIGYIHTSSGYVIPASEIRAGQRIKITNFFGDQSGTGLTLLITATDYDHDSRSNSLSIGKPDHLSAYLAREYGE